MIILVYQACSTCAWASWWEVQKPRSLASGLLYEEYMHLLTGYLLFLATILYSVIETKRSQ